MISQAKDERWIKLIDEKVNWLESQLMKMLIDEKVDRWVSWLRRKAIDENFDWWESWLIVDIVTIDC